MRLTTFADLGLELDDTDATVWQLCQDRGIVLITDNRNARGPDSLQAVIEARNSPTCLPVLTIADAQGLQDSADATEAIIQRLLDYLMRLDELRGTGRLFLP